MNDRNATPAAGITVRDRKASRAAVRRRAGASVRSRWRASSVARRYDDETIATLKEMLPEVLRNVLGVEDLTRPFRCPCPDHEDRTPSAHYYAEGNVVKCFGCGGTFAVFDLVGFSRGIDGFPERVRATAEICGVSLWSGGRMARAMPNVSRGAGSASRMFAAPQPAGTDESLLPSVMDACDLLYTPKGDFSRQWLHGRGIDDEAILRCGLGLALSARDVSERFSVHEEKAVFVVVPYPETRDFHEVHYAVLRTVVSKGCAPSRKEWRMKGVRSPLFREWALSSGAEAVAVCEGPLDAIALESRHPGLQTMALGGTSMASRLLAVVGAAEQSARPRIVVLALDEDDAGRACAEKLESGLGELGVACMRYPGFGGHKDPNDWLQAGCGVAWHYEETRICGLRVPYRKLIWEEP